MSEALTRIENEQIRKKFRHICEKDALVCKCIQQMVRTSVHEASAPAPPACGVNSAQCPERVPEPHTANPSPSPSRSRSLSPPSSQKSPSTSGVTLPLTKSHCTPPAHLPHPPPLPLPPPPPSTSPAPELCAQHIGPSQSPVDAPIDKGASPKGRDNKTKHGKHLSSVHLSTHSHTQTRTDTRTQCFDDLQFCTVLFAGMG